MAKNGAEYILISQWIQATNDLCNLYYNLVPVHVKAQDSELLNSENRYIYDEDLNTSLDNQSTSASCFTPSNSSETKNMYHNIINEQGNYTTDYALNSKEYDVHSSDSTESESEHNDKKHGSISNEEHICEDDYSIIKLQEKSDSQIGDQDSEDNKNLNRGVLIEDKVKINEFKEYCQRVLTKKLMISIKKPTPIVKRIKLPKYVYYNDWICRGCFNYNFNARKRCFICKSLRIERAIYIC
eukprot:Mrub_04473.p1 GENE.Mrub_04473~~Mrub_04473.p1  ORF type:complete len:281 (+),score=38.67 Mrub_04473:123-845(+)